MLREVYKCTLSFDNFVTVHPHLNNMQLCGKNCISNFPHQATNFNICVLHACSLQYVFGFKSIRAQVLTTSAMPAFLSWTFNISDYNDYLRLVFIKWFLIDGIDQEFTRVLTKKVNGLQFFAHNVNLECYFLSQLIEEDMVRKFTQSANLCYCMSL